MTDNLVTRLRESHFLDIAEAWDLCDEAADRIERLEGLLIKLIWDCDYDGPEDFCGKDRCACKVIMPVIGDYDA
jgi:hypothetical protein